MIATMRPSHNTSTTSSSNSNAGGSGKQQQQRQEESGGSGSSKNSGSGRFRNFLSRPNKPAPVNGMVDFGTTATTATTVNSATAAANSTTTTGPATPNNGTVQNNNNNNSGSGNHSSTVNGHNDNNNIKPLMLAGRSISSTLPLESQQHHQQHTFGRRGHAPNDFDEDPPITASPGGTPPKKIWEGAYSKFLRGGGGGSSSTATGGGDNGEGSRNGSRNGTSSRNQFGGGGNTTTTTSSNSPSRSSPPTTITSDHNHNVATHGRKSAFSLIPGSKRLVTSSRNDLPGLGGGHHQQQYQHRHTGAAVDSIGAVIAPPLPNLKISPRSNSIPNQYQYHHHNNVVVSNGTNNTNHGSGGIGTLVASRSGEDGSVRGGSIFKAVFSRGTSVGSGAGTTTTTTTGPAVSDTLSSGLDETSGRGRRTQSNNNNNNNTGPRHRSHMSMNDLDVPMRRGIDKASSNSASPEYHPRRCGHQSTSSSSMMMIPPPPPLPSSSGGLTTSMSDTWTGTTTAFVTTTPPATSHKAVVEEQQQQQRQYHLADTPEDGSMKGPTSLNALLASASSTPTSQYQRQRTRTDWNATTIAPLSSSSSRRTVSMNGLLHPMMTDDDVTASMMMGPTAAAMTSRQLSSGGLQPRGQQNNHFQYGYDINYQQYTYYPQQQQISSIGQDDMNINNNNHSTNDIDRNHEDRSSSQSIGIIPHLDDLGGRASSLTASPNHHQVGLNMDDSDNSLSQHTDDLDHINSPQQPLRGQSLGGIDDRVKHDATTSGIAIEMMNALNDESSNSVTARPMPNSPPTFADGQDMDSPSSPHSRRPARKDVTPSGMKKAFTKFHNASQFGQDSASAFLGADQIPSNTDLVGELDSFVSYHAAMLMRPTVTAGVGGMGNSVPTAYLERNLNYFGSHSLPLDTVDEQNISIHKGMRLLKPIQGTETWQQGRRYLIAPAALASCPLPVINKLSGSSVHSVSDTSTAAVDAAEAGVVDTNSGDRPPVQVAQCFGMIDLGQALMTYVGEKHHLSLGKWSSCRLVLRQNYLFEYDLDSAVSSLPRGCCHLQHAVACQHQDFADALELNFFWSPCAKSDHRVLMIRAQNREQRDRWVTYLNRAANLKITDLWEYDEATPLGTGRYADIFIARRRTDRPLSSKAMECRFPTDSNEFRPLKSTERGGIESYHTCTLKIVNKNEFWRRVVKGMERADTLVRELAVQSTMTAKCKSISSFLLLRGFFETSDNVVLELEALGGRDLFEYISSKGVLAEDDASRIIRDVLTCLDAMNRVGIAHRDVKPANILMSNGTDGTTVKVADFGMSTFVGVDGLVRGRCGTPGYVAPEILAAGTRSGYGNQVDIFSAGVTLYVMLCGYEPFYGESEKELIEANRRAEIDFPKSDWGGISSDARDLVERMLKVDSKERITAKEALRHPWLTRFEKKQSVNPESTSTVSNFEEVICAIM